MVILDSLHTNTHVRTFPCPSRVHSLQLLPVQLHTYLGKKLSIIDGGKVLYGTKLSMDLIYLGKKLLLTGKFCTKSFKAQILMEDTKIWRQNEIPGVRVGYSMCTVGVCDQRKEGQAT